MVRDGTAWVLWGSRGEGWQNTRGPRLAAELLSRGPMSGRNDCGRLARVEQL